jgi:type III pantothenate kinase
MLVAVDVGNTTTKIGRVSADGRVESVWRLATDARRTADEWSVFLGALTTKFEGQAAPTAVVIASVVPAVTPVVAAALAARFGREPVVLTSELNLGIEVRTAVPAETGIDRVVNALAARETLGAPCVVLDCGTATKVDAVAADGAFVGGAIGPGLEIARDALAGRAARLFAVELIPPATAIGRSTVESVQAGLVLGYLEMCAGLVRRARAELGGGRVIATGGAGALAGAHLDEVERWEPTLTLAGIARAYNTHRELVDLGPGRAANGRRLS